jgi:hypothetical protein
MNVGLGGGGERIGGGRGVLHWPLGEDDGRSVGEKGRIFCYSSSPVEMGKTKEDEKEEGWDAVVAIRKQNI